jgi:hypothetical protein
MQENTMNAIIGKSIIFATRSPHMNFEFATVEAILLRSPDGKNDSINGVIISVTNAGTS